MRYQSVGCMTVKIRAGGQVNCSCRGYTAHKLYSHSIAAAHNNGIFFDFVRWHRAKYPSRPYCHEGRDTLMKSVSIDMRNFRLSTLSIASGAEEFQRSEKALSFLKMSTRYLDKEDLFCTTKDTSFSLN